MARIKKLSWWHEMVVDWMLTNPDGKLKDCAEFFSVTQPWLSTVVNSDAFKHYFRVRRKEHQGLVSATVIDKVEGLGKLSLDVLEERIENDRENISLGIVRETAEMALKALGYGGRGAMQAAPVQVNIGVVTPDLLERARAKMRDVSPRTTEITEDVQGQTIVPVAAPS